MTKKRSTTQTEETQPRVRPERDVPKTPRDRTMVALGGHLERRAFRDHIRRVMRGTSAADGKSTARVLAELIAWTLKRPERFNHRPGGLGK